MQLHKINIDLYYCELISTHRPIYNMAYLSNIIVNYRIHHPGHLTTYVHSTKDI